MSCSQEPQGPRPVPLFSYFTKDVAFWTSQLAEPFETPFDLTPCLVEHVGFARYYSAKKLEVKLCSVYLAMQEAVGSIPRAAKYAHANRV